MTFRIQLAAALLCSVAVIATSRTASAQSPRGSTMQSGAQPLPQNAAVEELPTGQMGSESHPQYYPGGAGESEFTPNGYYPEGHKYPDAHGYTHGHDEGHCAEGCCNPPSCGSEACCDSSGGLFSGGQFYFTADYLITRASFSEAIAFVDQDLTEGEDEFVPLDFEYESSYRFGGGYRLCGCGQTLRFMFTRMQSDADDTAFPGDIVPFETAPPPGGQTNINADVDALSLDLECAKTIPLGGQCCQCCDTCGDGCQDACGCGEACCKSCPAWDITWSGGVRIADVDWDRSFVAVDANEFPVTTSEVEMEFTGGGPRFGLEGRRYFFCDGWLSVYLKGDISLLLGDVEIEASREVDDPATAQNPDVVNTQTFETRQIIPVTEIEAGLTTQVTCNTAITAGYLFSAWHDLGFRDDFQLNTLLPLRYDDANILGFDGFFARMEFAY